MMKIFDTVQGPYPARVRIAVAEKNMTSAVEFVAIDLMKGEHKTPAFRDKNYSGTLPVLELGDGTFIAECTAITQYFDTLDGQPLLTGKTPKEQGIIHMMTKRAEIELMDAISIYFHHATPGLGPLVEKYQNADWGRHQLERAMRGMRYFDGVVRQQPFVAGEVFSMADIALVGGLIFAGYLNVEVPADCTGLRSWYAEMQTRPSVKNWMSMK